jgi:NADH dehydrogenase FAD-containing subunit
VAADGLLDEPARENGSIIRVKPVENAREIRDRLRDFRGERPPKVLVVGGGAAGCEVAANVLVLFARLGGGELTLVHGGASLLPSAPKRARAEISVLLRSRGARVLTDTRIVRLGDGAARTAAGQEIPYDLAVLATGISPCSLFRASELPTADGGGLLVDSNLRVSGDERLFGGGDCISFGGRTLPKLGVFAVRQGPVILHNLQAILEGSPLRRYDPQDRFLYVLNLGDGTGLGVYGDLTWRGRLPYLLKNLIDRRFVRGMSRSR